MRPHGADIWMYGAAPDTIIDFSSNINPLGPPPGTETIAADTIRQIRYYPEPDAVSLVDMLADKHSLSTGNILTGNGSVELIYRFAEAFDIKRALVVVPVFTEYEQALSVNSIVINRFYLSECEGFKIDFDKLINAAEDADAVFLCNPNNPTGLAADKNGLNDLLCYCERKSVFLFVDEAFAEFSACEYEVSMLSRIPESRSLIVLRSMTKIYAVAGLRLGYLCADSGSIKIIKEKMFPWNINIFAQAVGKYLTTQDDFVRRSREYISSERRRFAGELSRISSLSVFDSDVNFVLCRLTGDRIRSAGELKQKLLRYNILIRDCSDFTGLSDEFFRLAVRTEDENDLLIKILKEYLL